MSENVQDCLEDLIRIEDFLRQTEHAVSKLTQIEQILNERLEQLKLILHEQCVPLRLSQVLDWKVWACRKEEYDLLDQVNDCEDWCAHLMTHGRCEALCLARFLLLLRQVISC